MKILPRLLRVPNSVIIVPVNSFFDRSIVFKDTTVDNSFGIVPISLLFDKSIIVKVGIDPNSVGIVPPSDEPVIIKDFKNSK